MQSPKLPPEIFQVQRRGWGERGWEGRGVAFSLLQLLLAHVWAYVAQPREFVSHLLLMRPDASIISPCLWPPGPGGLQKAHTAARREALKNTGQTIGMPFIVRNTIKP